MKSKSFLLVFVGMSIGWGLNSFFNGDRSPKLPIPNARVSEPNVVPSIEVVKPIERKMNSPESKPGKIIESGNERNLGNIKEDFENAMNSEKFQEAATILAEMEKGGKESRQFLESKSRYLVRTRDYENAKDVLDKCVQLFPDSKTCLVDRASTLLSIGTKDEQEKAALACLAKYPNDLQCRNMLAIVRMNQGQFSLAVTIYEEIMRDNGSYGMRFPQWLLDSQMGTALEGAGRLSEAASYFDRSCQSGQNENACTQLNAIRARL